MEKYTYTKDCKDIEFKYISDNIDDILYFDIETTGFMAKSTDLYLIGYAHNTARGFEITLLFNDDGCSEQEMLKTFADILMKFKVLVSYNGDTFDIPYLNEKFAQFNINCDIKSLISSFDIYKIVKKYKNRLHLQSIKQSDIEKLVKINREEFISGGELIQIYKKYLQYHQDIDLNRLISHNHDDINGLIQLTNILSIHNLFTGKYDIGETIVADNKLCISINLHDAIPVRINYANEYFYVNGYKNEVKIYIQIINDTLKYYFKDYKNYYFLPYEEMAIHKSMATYVDSNHKVKATKATAFTKKEGAFIRCPKYVGAEQFCYNIKDNTKYILLDDNLLMNKELLYKYTLALLS